MSQQPDTAAVQSAHLLDPDDADRASRRAALDARPIPAPLRSHKAAAELFEPGPDLVDAVNVALTVGAPLLLTGEPGTGKTQVAYYLAWYFDTEIFPMAVRSDSTAKDLLYRFDAVAYLHSANDPARDSTRAGQSSLIKDEFITRGPLWQAYGFDGTPVVLIDEIDKASRDFPNDLLNVIDQHWFVVRELDNRRIERGDRPPPLVVLTSNSERRLPEPFLRRCIFHHIEFNIERVRRAVELRAEKSGLYRDLPADVREAAIQRFMDLRSSDLNKKPSTAELLVWLLLLEARGGVTAQALADADLRGLPALTALVKDRDDLQRLGAL
ncbi:MAG: MoxR family ATPase [Acidobacteriota bacterium]